MIVSTTTMNCLARRVLKCRVSSFKDLPVCSVLPPMCQYSILHKHTRYDKTTHESLVKSVWSNYAHVKWYSTSDKKPDPKSENKEVKLTLFKRFKQMYREYWYVLVPVHLVTSAAWFGGFYYLAKSGVDVPALLESMSVSETITKPLKDSKMGYMAISYALYKIATPARYTVTLGGTTVAINYLKRWGWVKPVPSREALKEMYNERKDNIIENVLSKKENLLSNVKEKRDELKMRKDGIMENVKSLPKMNSCKKNN